MKDCKINILGTDYDFKVDCNEKDADGSSRFYGKRISIKPFDEMLDDDSFHRGREACQAKRSGET